MEKREVFVVNVEGKKKSICLLMLHVYEVFFVLFLALLQVTYFLTKDYICKVAYII